MILRSRGAKAPLLSVDLMPARVALNLRESGAVFPCKWCSVAEIYNNYSICRIYVFSVHLGNGPLKFLILGTQQKINQMHDTYTIDISSSQVIHGHNVLGIVVFDFQQVYDFPVRGVG